jgi:hypothetical protein
LWRWLAKSEYYWVSTERDTDIWRFKENIKRIEFTTEGDGEVENTHLVQGNGYAKFRCTANKGKFWYRATGYFDDHSE